MSYESYALSEMAIVNTPKIVQNRVISLLDIIDGQGHSGGSMGFFGPSVKQWAKDPVLITNPSDLRYKLSEFLKDLEHDDRAATLTITARVMRFIPLSFLTGADDEWHLAHDNTYQNNRLSSVFKQGKDGDAYWIDGIIYCHPYSDYTGWSSWTRGGGASRKFITFPYDPETPSERRYFTDPGFEYPIPQSVDANQWLSWQSDLFNKGIDPATGKVREVAMFHQSNISTLCYAELITSFDISDPKVKLDIITRLGWVDDASTPFKFEFNNPAGGMIERVISDYDAARKLIRMLAITPDGLKGTYCLPGYESNEILEDAQGNRYTVGYDFVQVPTPFYSGWDNRPTGVELVVKIIPVSEQGKPAGCFYYDGGHHITGDQVDYLYQKRREHGFAHPKRKTTSSKVGCDPIPEPPVPDVDSE